MFEMAIGALVALCFLGLPLAIIGLFIASTFDRRNATQGFTASREVAASASTTTLTIGGVVLSTVDFRWPRQQGQRAPRAARSKWQQVRDVPIPELTASKCSRPRYSV
jgi:hypothetical protein